MRGNLFRLLSVLGALVLGACGGGGGGAPPARPTTVEGTLAALRVQTPQTPRVADKVTKVPLPDDYAPFGAALTFDKVDELMTIGFGLTGLGDDAVKVTVLEELQASPGVFTAEKLWRPTDTPWAVSSGAAPTMLRAAAAGDVDGDGLEEILIVSHAAGDAAIVLRTIQDRVAAFTSATPVPVSSATPTSLAIATGDFDGDGKKDAVVAVGTAADVQLVFLKGTATGMALAGKTVTLPPLTAAPTGFEVVMATGNLDHDLGEELAVVVNERYQSGGAESGAARTWIFDDGNAGFALRQQGQRVSANVAGADRSALTASVAVGDVDGDGVAEVVLAGLTSFDPAHACAYGYLLLALDGLDAGLAPLGAAYYAGRATGAVSPPYPALFPQDAVCTDLRLRAVQLVTLDRDADGADEIQANQLAFEDFRQAPAPWTLLVSTQDPTLHDLFGGTGSTFTGEFSRATSAFAAGDLTGEGSADLVLYSQSASAAGAPAVRIWADTTDADWHRTISLPVAAPPAEPLWPILVTANVDRDSMSVQFAPASRKVVFTEPIVIAAMALPPCNPALGQDMSLCQTSFAKSASTATETETSWSVKAGITVGAEGGVDVFGLKFKTEVTAKVTGYYSRKSSSSYSLTKTVTYDSGPFDDAVIFTSIPFDQYTYRILSHPDASLIGKEIVISLPREPIHTSRSRTDFNASVLEGAVQIDRTVFGHTIGRPATYPTAAQRDALVAGNPDLADGPFTVCGTTGGGMGSEIDLEVLGTSGSTWGVEAELEVKATAGAVITGFTIGGGYESSLQVTHGTGTAYSGYVSCIPAAQWNPDTYYRWGIMAYVHQAPQQSFEVINYWVE